MTASATVELDPTHAPGGRHDRPRFDPPSDGVARRAGVLTALAVLLTLGAYLWFVVPQLGRPYVYDDVNFALGARAVARTGLPFGNQGYLLHLVEQREQWALWHPPLYIFSLGLWTRLFGESEVATRSFSVLCLLLSAGVAFDLARRVVVDRGGSRARGLAAGALAVALLLLNPLALQSSGILDIDNTVLMLLLTVAVWAAVRLPGHWDWRAVGLLSILYAVTLWAKLTSPIILLAALIFTRLFQGTGLRGAVEALTVGVLGWFGFFLSWAFVNWATGMPWDYTLTVVYREALESSHSSGHRLASLPAFLNGVAPALLWIGPFFCLLFVAAGLPRLLDLLRGRGLVAGDLLVVLGAAIYLAYFAKLAGNFPKYHAVMLPLWAAACGALVARTAGRPRPVQLAVAALGCVGLTAWLLGPVAAHWTISWTPGLISNLILAPLAVGAALALAWILLGRDNVAGAAPVALLVVTLAWSVALDVAQRDREGSTTYFYDRRGQREAVAALERVLRPDEVYVASKEVAWYATNQQYVDQESWMYVVWGTQGGAFDGTYFGREIRVLALVDADGPLRETFDGALQPRYRPIGDYGSFTIYVRAE
jgi:hypothetical protein